MGLFDKLFGTPAGTTGSDLWAGVPSIGSPMATRPEIKAKLTPSRREDTTQHAMLAMAATTHQFTSPRGDAIYIFDFFGDPTVICKMSDSRAQEILPRCEFFVESVDMPTYPVLRTCLDWTRKAGDSPLTFESTQDLRNIDIQQFFSALLRSSKLWIHAVRDDAPIPRFTAQMSFDTARMGYYRGELQTAIACFTRLPSERRNYERAVLACYKASPMQCA